MGPSLSSTSFALLLLLSTAFAIDFSTLINPENTDILNKKMDEFKAAAAKAPALAPLMSAAVKENALAASAIAREVSQSPAAEPIKKQLSESPATPAVADGAEDKSTATSQAKPEGSSAAKVFVSTIGVAVALASCIFVAF